VTLENGDLVAQEEDLGILGTDLVGSRFSQPRVIFACPRCPRERDPAAARKRGHRTRTKTLLSCHPAGRVVAPDLCIRPARDGV
jgi:hypothetical protein